ncbi:MAG: ATP-dependent Clp protease ATP-binding subunit [bacterium]|nr:ATP-dependent Clp protease ATP-binding subunit [bacterium]
MKSFELQKTKVFKALVLNKIFPVRALHKIAALGFLAMCAFAVLRFALPKLLGEDRTVGLFLLSAGVTYVFWVYTLFFETYLDNVEKPAVGEENLANYLDFVTTGIFDRYINSGNGDLSVLLLEIVRTPGAQFVLYRMGVAPQQFESELKNYLGETPKPFDPEAVRLFLEDALDEKNKNGQSGAVTWRDLMLALCVNSEFFRRFIFDAHLEKQDIKRILDWQAELEAEHEEKRKFWTYENLMRSRGIGKDWSWGYTINLDNYATDVSILLLRRGFAPRLYGREKETEAVERILARAGENNVILVGEEGVGRRTIAHALAKKIINGQTLAQLAHKRVLELDVGAVLANSASEHEVEGRLKLILNEAVRAGNVILLIEEVHSLFDSSRSTGTINATEILLPYLNSSLFQVIGITSHRGYNDTIARNSSLTKVFAKVEVKEPSKENVFEILHDVVPQIEAHSQVLILYQAIKEAINLSDRYIKNVPFPAKTIDVLQEAAVYAQTKARSPVVTASHVEEVVHRKTDIPVGKIALAEKDVLLNLESILHRKVIGQEDAILAISNAMRRARSGIASEKKPIGSFLFLGPTGVGKTETAKALASVYFGSEKRMIRFDMSEYQQPDSIRRLIGYDQEAGQLTTAIMEHPFSLLLLDEIEKSHPNILNLFLQVLDDGRLTDALGRTVDFTNTIIITTSNAGAELIRESIQQFHEANLKERLLDHLQKQGIFRPEFLNRFDSVIVFRPLTSEQTEQVVELLLADLSRRLREKDVTLKFDFQAVKKIAQLGYDPQFGARPLRRVIQDRVENLVATKLLSGQAKRGDVIEIKAEEIEIPIREVEPAVENK